MTLTRLALLIPVLALGACAQVMTGTPSATPAAAPRPTAAPAPTQTAPRPRPVARATPAQMNTTSAAQRAEAAARPASAETRLGSTIASLGDPTQPGFWAKTPLVSATTQGRLVNPANGKSAKVELIPLPGPKTAGSQVSLPALQLLGVALTDLPRLDVFSAGG